MGAGPLTSTRSARVTEVRHLHDRRHRAQRGVFVVEGPPSVEAAIRHGVTDIFVTDEAAQRHPDLIAEGARAGARITPASDEVIAAMSETRQSQGILALCPLVTRPLDEAIAGSGRRARGLGPPLLVILDRVSDPGNAGTIIRTADAMGATAVVLTTGSVDPHNGKCVRSTAGSLFHLPVADGVPAAAAIEACRARGLRILAADGGGSVSLDASEALQGLRGPAAWVFGSEAHGLEDEWRQAADLLLRIPMPGQAESLNVASAAAMCLYATACARSGAAHSGTDARE